MTVRELQELLKSYDPATQVAIQGDKYGQPYFCVQDKFKTELVQTFKSTPKGAARDKIVLLLRKTIDETASNKIADQTDDAKGTLDVGVDGVSFENAT